MPSKEKKSEEKEKEKKVEKPSKKVDPEVIKNKEELLDLRYKEWLHFAQY